MKDYLLVYSSETDETLTITTCVVEADSALTVRDYIHNNGIGQVEHIEEL